MDDRYAAEILDELKRLNANLDACIEGIKKAMPQKGATKVETKKSKN